MTVQRGYMMPALEKRKRAAMDPLLVSCVLSTASCQGCGHIPPRIDTGLVTHAAAGEPTWTL